MKIIMDNITPQEEFVDSMKGKRQKSLACMD